MIELHKNERRLCKMMFIPLSVHQKLYNAVKTYRLLDGSKLLNEYDSI